MINILVVKKHNRIMTIEATGHSGYATEGSDIVCSAVSTLLETLLNSLIDIVKINPDYKIDESIPHLSVSLPKALDKAISNKVDLLMESTYLGIRKVADCYKKYIKIKEKLYDI